MSLRTIPKICLCRLLAKGIQRGTTSTSPAGEMTKMTASQRSAAWRSACQRCLQRGRAGDQYRGRRRPSRYRSAFVQRDGLAFVDTGMAEEHARHELSSGKSARVPHSCDASSETSSDCSAEFVTVRRKSITIGFSFICILSSVEIP